MLIEAEAKNVPRDQVIKGLLFEGLSVGGTSGRARAFCPGRLGSNPGIDLGFFSSEFLSIHSHWVGAFSNNV